MEEDNFHGGHKELSDLHDKQGGFFAFCWDKAEAGFKKYFAGMRTKSLAFTKPTSVLCFGTKCPLKITKVGCTRTIYVPEIQTT